MTHAFQPLALLRYSDPTRGVQTGILRGDRIYNVSEHVPLLSGWLARSTGRAAEAVAALAWIIDGCPHFPAADMGTAPDAPRWLAPVDEQDIWAAGVTYERSRHARQEEAADGGDVYARVYAAERPELFFKGHGRDAVGHLDAVGIRADSRWNVPEPELAVVLNPALEAVGFTIGSDMSSRDIEGANPLYLPQAKVYTRACALGPAIALVPGDLLFSAAIGITIERGGAAVFSGETHTDRIRRSLRELTGYLGRANEFPRGVVLLTGTGIVPPAEFTLEPGDWVHIRIDGLGVLSNPVVTVGGAA
jgi:2-dehydro-3-deoxy-D-arabinonate dehydratase